eukprot:COSAG02_NODE_10224_length_1992_cov_1.106709_3_plen_207_part_00
MIPGHSGAWPRFSDFRVILVDRQLIYGYIRLDVYGNPACGIRHRVFVANKRRLRTTAELHDRVALLQNQCVGAIVGGHVGDCISRSLVNSQTIRKVFQSLRYFAIIDSKQLLQLSSQKPIKSSYDSFVRPSNSFCTSGDSPLILLLYTCFFWAGFVPISSTHRYAQSQAPGPTGMPGRRSVTPGIRPYARCQELRCRLARPEGQRR